MWYHDPRKANDLGFGAPAQLTEWTFRDPHQAVHVGPNGKLMAPDMAESEVRKLVNYDVSYVDNLSMSASMEATNAEIPGQFLVSAGTGNYGWTGADLTYSQMQQFIENFTTNNTAINTPSDENSNGLGTYFGGLGWDQYYLPPDNSPTGQIIDINNHEVGKPVIITQLGANALLNGMTIKISGVMGQNGNDPQSGINDSFEVAEIAGGTFKLKKPDGTFFNGDNTPSVGGSYAAQTTGIHLLKIPSGYQALSDSSNGDHVSTYNPNQFTLASGGAVNQVDTLSTGIAKKGEKEITGVSAAVMTQLVPGMLWRPVADPSGTNYFPTGTYIASLSGTTITMSQAANVNGPDQATPTTKISWTFVGSQYTSTTGKTDGANPLISGLDPKVGMYLRPGMGVKGASIAAGTFVGSVTNSFTQVNLVDKDGVAISPVPAVASGPYSFTGAPDSYIVQTLINNWYAWADYYVRNQQTALPAGGVTSTGSVSGSEQTQLYPDGRQNPDAIILKGIDPTVFSKLAVGDVVTGPGLTVNATLGTDKYDPSLNYAIAKLNPKGYPANSVQLTLPTAKAASGSYTFTAPQYVLRSGEAPIVPATAITGIANDTGSPVTITTGSSAGLANGVLVTISGVTGAGAPRINGNWVISGLATSGANTTFHLANTSGVDLVGNGQGATGGNWAPAPFAGATSVPATPYALSFAPAQQAEALKFAATVYDVMQSMSLLTGANPETNLSKSTQLLTEIIGGNVGNFQAYNDLFEKRTHLKTTLPRERTNAELRDEIKSLLRGVYDFQTVTDQSKWYPDPAVATPGARVNGKNVTFGIYNLDPYVWFVHVQLQQNGYGFSLDDDVANSSAIANSLQIAFGGNEYTAPLTTAQGADRPKLENLESFTGGAPFGTVQSTPITDPLTKPTAYIDVQSVQGKAYQEAGLTMIAGLSEKVVAQLVSSSQPGDPLGAYITSPSGQYHDPLLPPGVTVMLAQVVHNASDDSKSFVVFKNPDPQISPWRPPTENGSPSYYTFSGFTTELPADVTTNVWNGLAGAPLTLTGAGFTGGISAHINTMNAPIVKGAITKITNTSGSPVTITTANTPGLAKGDPVTISGVTDQTTGKAAAINDTWTVAEVTAGASTTTFQLNVNGDGHTLSQSGSWIAGSDSALKVIIPTPTRNSNGTTFPGPVGKIGVKTPSGTNYSSNDFTIGEPPSIIMVLAGDQQRDVVDTTFAAPLQALVTDASGKPVVGARVTFVAPGGGAGGTFAGGATTETVATDASGVATSSVFTANGTVGPFAVTANVDPALATPASFALMNLTASQSFVNALYVAFLGRDGTVPELDAWVAALPSAGRDGVVNGIMRSGEALTRVVDGLYLRLLGRAPEPVGRAGWVSALASGRLTEEQAIAGIAASPEFAARARALFPSSPPDAAFVEALYSLLLNRTAEAAGLAGWVSALPSLGRTRVASGIVGSAEFRAGAVRTFYGDPTLTPSPYQPFFVDLLHRPARPGQSEVSGWVNASLDLLSIEAGFAASAEFFQLTTR